VSENQRELVNKAIVAGTAFCCSCAAFALAVTVLIPVCGTLLQAIQAPAVIQQGFILFCLFVAPIVAAIGGISLGERFIQTGMADQH